MYCVYMSAQATEINMFQDRCDKTVFTSFSPDTTYKPN